ncbi:MAG TPA: circadian clock KaiB family protein [Thermoanaerobaculia bacterium]|nr:circadian clock KaiB family protein [Thermoanaerobaculia bacterium]
MDALGIELAGEPDEGPLPAALPRYILRLYVTGKTPNSVRAIAKVKEVCEEFLPGQYQLQVIDIYQQPALAEGDHIQVAPTLVRRAPGPLRRLIGNLYDRDRLLAGLELQPVAGG